MNILKRHFIMFLLGLLSTQAALAYYCPSTGCWPNRDPIDEPGFSIRTAKSDSSDMEEEQLKLRMQSFKPDDVGLFRAWVHELAMRQRLRLTPYAKPSLTQVGEFGLKENYNPYLFNHNDAIDRVDNMGLLSLPPPPPVLIFFKCISIKCGLYLCIGKFQPPTWFPRDPLALEECLGDAGLHLLGACITANHASFNSWCVSSYGCYQANW
jgi:hypothetical protein